MVSVGKNAENPALRKLLAMEKTSGTIASSSPLFVDWIHNNNTHTHRYHDHEC